MSAEETAVGMKSMSKQRGMGCTGKPNPPGRADEAGGFVRDKVRRGQNVALSSPVRAPKNSDSFAPEIGSSVNRLLANWPACISVLELQRCAKADMSLAFNGASILVEAKEDLSRQREEGRAEKSMCKVLGLKEHQDYWGQDRAGDCAWS